MELPEDILVRILSRLHPLQAVRATLVCRSWRRAIISSHSCSHPSSFGFAIDSPSASRTLLYADLSCSRWVPLPLLPEPAFLLAIVNPFICLSTTSSSKPHFTQLHLLNPLTREHLCIPPLRHAPFLVGLYTEPRSHSFKIVTAGQKAVADRSRLFDLDLVLPVQIFDSSSNSWRMAGSVSGAAPEYASPIFMGQHIYWLSRRSLKKHVLVFDAVEETWSQLCVSWPQDLSPFTLWPWDGHLYMAGEFSSALMVWRLSTDSRAWVMHTCIPSNVAHVDFFCGAKDVAGHGHLLCIMLIWARKSIVYDLRTHSTSCFPYCPVSSYNWGNVLPYRPGFSKLSGTRVPRGKHIMPDA